MTKSEIIEINGRRYDTRSGAVLHKSKDKLRKSDKEDKVAASKVNESSEPPTISENDGDFKSSPSWQKSGKSHKIAQHRKAHRAEKASTLLRSAVKKPLFKKDSKLGSVSSALESVNEDAQKISVNVGRSADKVEHASQVPQSDLISKFSDSDSSKNEPTVEAVEVKKSPEPEHQPAVPEELPKQAGLANPFDTAVERAHSHEEKLAKPAPNFSRLMARVLMVIVVVFAVLTTVLYVETPKIDVSLAAYQSTVAATMPTWIPAGYSFRSPVSYSYGRVVLTYANGVQTLRITEETTSWSTTGLLDNYVVQTGQSYQTLTSAHGPTLYVLADGSATWVKGTVWYQLSDTTRLSANTIQSIANNS